MQEQINQLTEDLKKSNKKIDILERISIQDTFEPTTYLYLKKVVTDIATVVITALFATKPTSTYSLSAPTGTAIAGSTWYYDTESLATREIYVYSGSSWVKMK